MTVAHYRVTVELVASSKSGWVGPDAPLSVRTYDTGKVPFKGWIAPEAPRYTFDVHSDAFAVNVGHGVGGNES